MTCIYHVIQDMLSILNPKDRSLVVSVSSCASPISVVVVPLVCRCALGAACPHCFYELVREESAKLYPRGTVLRAAVHFEPKR